jgi:hypothetical protein
MMVFELLYLGMLLVRVAIWFVRVLVMLHVALIAVALPAGLLVRAGMIRDVNAFALVSCVWAALLLCGWTVVTRARRRDAGPSPRGRAERRRAQQRATVRPVRA